MELWKLWSNWRPRNQGGNELSWMFPSVGHLWPCCLQQLGVHGSQRSQVPPACAAAATLPRGSWIDSWHLAQVIHTVQPSVEEQQTCQSLSLTLSTCWAPCTLDEPASLECHFNVLMVLNTLVAGLLHFISVRSSDNNLLLCIQWDFLMIISEAELVHNLCDRKAWHFSSWSM